MTEAAQTAREATPGPGAQDDADRPSETKPATRKGLTVTDTRHSHCGRARQHPAHLWIVGRTPYSCPGAAGPQAAQAADPVPAHGPLREQIAAAIVRGGACVDLAAATDAVLAVTATALRDQRDRQAEQTVDLIQRYADTQIALREILAALYPITRLGDATPLGWQTGHPIPDRIYQQWRAVLPEAAPGYDGPSVAEAAADDRRWWNGEKTGER